MVRLNEEITRPIKACSKKRVAVKEAGKSIIDYITLESIMVLQIEYQEG